MILGLLGVSRDFSEIQGEKYVKQGSPKSQKIMLTVTYFHNKFLYLILAKSMFT